MASDCRRRSVKSTEPPRINLTGKGFLMEVENASLRQQVAECITSAGGHIVHCFDDGEVPVAIISDHPVAVKIENKVQVRITAAMRVPVLLNEAIKRKIKIRSPRKFLDQLHQYSEKRNKTTSATNSFSTIRGVQPSVRRGSTAHRPARPTPPIAPPPQPTEVPGNPALVIDTGSFVRIELPGKRPDVRAVDRQLLARVFSGLDTGHAIFKQADDSLRNKRDTEYRSFLKGRYTPSSTKNFKMDERDVFCHYCNRHVVGNRKDHEKKEEHRQKARMSTLGNSLNTVVSNTKILAERQQRRAERTIIETFDRSVNKNLSIRHNVEYEYGENSMKVEWGTLKKPKSKRSTSSESPTNRRRQRRIP